MTKTTITTTVLVLTFLILGKILAEDYHVNNSTELENAILHAGDYDVIFLDGLGPYNLGGIVFPPLSNYITIVSPDDASRTMIGGTLTVEQFGWIEFHGNMEFRGSLATQDGGVINAGYGGALVLRGTTIFRDNSTTGSGGAIAIRDGRVFVDLIHPGEFIRFQGNSDGSGSNAVHLDGTGSSLNFYHIMGTDVYFDDNPIAGTGGAINMNESGTVHINGGHSAFEGNTIVYNGYLQLENNAGYGVSGSGFLGVDLRGALSGSGTFSGDEIEIYGTVAPGLFMDKGNPSYQPGTLQFDAPTTFRSVSRYMPALWADGSCAVIPHTNPGTITVDPGATIYLNFRPGDYSQGTQTYTTIASEDFTVGKPGFIDASYSGTTGDITLNGLNGNYFRSQGVSGNLQSLASRFDAMIADSGTSDVWWDKLCGMSLSIENGGNFNQMLNSLAGAQRANTIGLSLMTPKELAFRHIGQNAIARCKYGNNLWFQPYYRHHTIHDSEDISGYNLSRPGFFIGLDRCFTRRSYGGMFTGYSAAKLSSDDYQADADVFTFGFLGGTRLDNGWDAKTWAVFGFENTRTNRLAAGDDPFRESIFGYAARPLRLDGNAQYGFDGFSDVHNGTTDGWSMGIGLEAGRTRTWRMNRFWDFSLRPFVGLDYEQANQYGFTESGDDEFAIHYLGGSMHRGLVRTGISATAGTYAVDLTGRVMYSGLIFGDTAPRSKAVLPSLMPDAFTVTGNDCGRNFINAGFDVSLWLNAQRSRYLTTTYEASMGHRLTSHTLTLAFVQRF